MLVLLPPSEGKSPTPRRGRPLRLESLSFPELAATRSRILDELVALCSSDEDRARAVLGLPPGLAAEIERNRHLQTAPAVRVDALYTGVLYDALDLATLDSTARARARRSLVVTSALWGALRTTDRVPAYRLSGDVSLPGTGPVAALWRAPMGAAMTAAAGRRGLVLDLRSSTYLALWRPTGTLAERTATVRVLHERRPGDRSSRVVVSHFNKATKGRVVRQLLQTGADPRNPDALAAVLRDLGHVVEPRGEARPGRPREFDLVVEEI